jgi:uncharacterized DUF497 family protein
MTGAGDIRSAYDRVAAATGFEWDEGNAEKSWTRHRVLPDEAEETFRDPSIVIVRDDRHSIVEERFAVFARTAAGRYLFLVFTFRGDQIRVISARDMSRRERRVYTGGWQEAEADSEV